MAMELRVCRCQKCTKIHHFHIKSSNIFTGRRHLESCGVDPFGVSSLTLSTPLFRPGDSPYHQADMSGVFYTSSQCRLSALPVVKRYFQSIVHGERQDVVDRRSVRVRVLLIVYIPTELRDRNCTICQCVPQSALEYYLFIYYEIRTQGTI